MILDQEMPGIGGIELMEMLHKGSVLPPPPVILMLSRPLESKARLECERLGIARTILKPIRRAWLVEALQQMAGEPKSEPAPAKIKGSALDGVSLRVLVADDNLVNQRLISRLLEKMGHQVVVASNGMAPEPRRDCRARPHTGFENTIAGWKLFPPVRLLARHDSRTK